LISLSPFNKTNSTAFSPTAPSTSSTSTSHGSGSITKPLVPSKIPQLQHRVKPSKSMVSMQSYSPTSLLKPVK
jgi:hypothetical protein